MGTPLPEDARNFPRGGLSFSAIPFFLRWRCGDAENGRINDRLPDSGFAVYYIHNRLLASPGDEIQRVFPASLSTEDGC